MHPQSRSPRPSPDVDKNDERTSLGCFEHGGVAADGDRPARGCDEGVTSDRGPGSVAANALRRCRPRSLCVRSCRSSFGNGWSHRTTGNKSKNCGNDHARHHQTHDSHLRRSHRVNFLGHSISSVKSLAPPSNAYSSLTTASKTAASAYASALCVESGATDLPSQACLQSKCPVRAGFGR